MKTNNLRFCLFLLLFASLLFCGCGRTKPVQVYTGSEKSISETVLLKCDYWTMLGDSQGTEVRKIWDSNDKLIWEGCSRLLVLMPGTYNLEVCYNFQSIGGGGAIGGASNQAAYENTKTLIKNNFEAGKQYLLKGKKTGLCVWDWKAIYWIEDLQTGQLVYGTRP